MTEIFLSTTMKKRALLTKENSTFIELLKTPHISCFSFVEKKVKIQEKSCKKMKLNLHDLGNCL